MGQAMKGYKARGVVLSTVKYGDSGMVVQMLTDRYGRQSYMVQGCALSRYCKRCSNIYGLLS